MKISELMTKEALVIKDSVPTDRMAKLFAKHEISGAPVINDQGDLVGVVSVADLSRGKKGSSAGKSDYYLNPSWGTVTVEKETSDTVTVKDIMTNLIICAEEDDDIEVAADHMVNHGIHRVIVTRENKVVGVITSSDLVREFRNRMKAAKQLR
jgi:CBS domain-containing protein